MDTVALAQLIAQVELEYQEAAGRKRGQLARVLTSLLDAQDAYREVAR